MDQSFSTTNPDRVTIVHNIEEKYTPVDRNAITTKKLAFHLFLLLITVFTTVGMGVVMFYDESVESPIAHALSQGLIYSFTLLTILTAHELGHYIACRRYGVEATLPYFLPVPIPPIGTFGAFIKIKSQIPSKRALFDIGIAGPLAGFVFAVPAAAIAYYFAVPSNTTEIPQDAVIFNSPLLFKMLETLFGVTSDININPVWWAAWIGVFMTALNLLPVGQLDGGHVTYAIFGRKGNFTIALTAYATVIVLAVYTAIREGSYNWVVYGVLLTFLLRVGHPPVTDESESLDIKRKIVAIIGLIVFIVSFMPLPISFAK